MPTVSVNAGIWSATRPSLVEAVDPKTDAVGETKELR